MQLESQLRHHGPSFSSSLGLTRQCYTRYAEITKMRFMNPTPEPAGPVAMEGNGGYNRRSRVQAAGLAPAVPLLLAAAAVVGLPAGSEPIVIADYGASQGGNSLEPIGLAIQTLRDRVGREWPITVFHTDLPDNDFSALFRALADDPRSYLRGNGAVFAAAVGRSFYEQILPANSVTLGWSSWAVQWLSQAPMPVPDQVQVALSRDPVAKAAFAEQAAADWRVFLTHRGAELRAGGRLIILTMALDASGSFGYEPVLAAMYGSLQEMVAEGFVAQEELNRMTIPTVGRSRADFLAPFESRPDERFAGLTVESLEMFPGEDRLWSQYEKDNDAEAFGAQWAAFSRASVLPTLAADLRGGRTDQRAAEFLSRVEQGMALKLARKPVRMGIPLARMTLRKE